MRRTSFGTRLAMLSEKRGRRSFHRKGSAALPPVSGTRLTARRGVSTEVKTPLALVTPVVLIQHHRVGHLGAV